MMATIRDICTDAWRGATNTLNGDMPAEEAARALRLLNNMMHGLTADGLYIGWTDAELNDDFPLEDQHREGVSAMLERRIVADNRGTLTESQIEAARRGETRLWADYKNVEDLRVDEALAWMPSQLRSSGFIVG